MCFIEPLGAGIGAAPIEVKTVVKALNRHTKFLRGVLGRQIDMKFTPDLKFVHDESFDEAARIAALFDDPRVRADLTRSAEDKD
jgi:ribosome-binding factor A